MKIFDDHVLHSSSLRVRSLMNVSWTMEGGPLLALSSKKLWRQIMRGGSADSSNQDFGLKKDSCYSRRFLPLRFGTRSNTPEERRRRWIDGLCAVSDQPRTETGVDKAELNRTVWRWEPLPAPKLVAIEWEICRREIWRPRAKSNEGLTSSRVASEWLHTNSSVYPSCCIGSSYATSCYPIALLDG